MVLAQKQAQRSIEQNNEPETNLCFHAQLIYDEVNNTKKTAFSINHVEKLDSYM